VGASALAANTTGADNTALGLNALASNTTGINNTASGRFALTSNTTGVGNTASGYSSLATNITGSYNTASGGLSLYSNTGSYNTAIGYDALNNNTASSNTAVGYQAAYTGTTATQVVAIGSGALYANTVNYGTAVGFNALTANTTGAANAAFGAYALSTNTTGQANSAFGALGFGLSDSALQANTTGSYNSAFGLGALAKNTTASNNTAVGYQAGYSNTTGPYNTFLGNASGYSNTGSQANTFVGFQSGYSTTGQGNTFVGAAGAGPYGSGYLVTTGSRNTILGAYNGNQGGLDIRTASNYIVLSDGDGNPRGIFDGSGNFMVNTTNPSAEVDTTPTTNQFSFTPGDGIRCSITGTNYFSRSGDGQIFNFRRNATTVGSISVSTGATAYNTSSDYRLKNTITPMTGALAKVAQLKPVTYKWNADGSDGEGFIAHELAEVCPSAVTGEKDAVDADGKIKPQGIDVSFLVATLTAAIQEQQAIIESLKARLDAANL
jgi:hypothetical protein